MPKFTNENNRDEQGSRRGHRPSYFYKPTDPATAPVVKGKAN